MTERTPDNVALGATWTLCEATLLKMLQRCYEGETPDMVYVEMYVNMFEDDLDQ